MNNGTFGLSGFNQVGAYYRASNNFAGGSAAGFSALLALELQELCSSAVTLFGNTDDSALGWDFRRTVDASGVLGTIGLSARAGDGAAMASADITLSKASAWGGTLLLGLTLSGTTLSLWVNGALVDTAVLGSAFDPNPGALAFGNRAGSVAAGAVDRLISGAYLPSVLTEAQMIDIWEGFQKLGTLRQAGIRAGTPFAYVYDTVNASAPSSPAPATLPNTGSILGGALSYQSASAVLVGSSNPNPTFVGVPGATGGGGGDVTGPGASTDDALVRWSGASGTAIANSNAILTDGGDLTLAGNISVVNLAASGTVSLPNLVINDTQHGNRSGGALHALVVSGGAAGFMSGTQSAALDVIAATYVPSSRTLTAGAGMTGGGDLSADRTFNVIANPDGSIVVNADNVQVGVLATDAQHGNRGGGALHALATALANGFLSNTDFIKLQTIPAAGVDQSEIIWGITGSALPSSFGNGLRYQPLRKSQADTVTGQFPAKQSGNVTLRIYYAMSVANSGNVALQLSRVNIALNSNPNAALVPQTAGTITPGNVTDFLDADQTDYVELRFAVTAGDEVYFTLLRVNDGTDTHTGDMRIIEIRAQYTL